MILSIFAEQLYRLQEFMGERGAALDYGKGLGISTVEIFTDELAGTTLHDYRIFIEEHGLFISNVIHVSNIATKSLKEFQAEITYLKKLADDISKEGIGRMMIVPVSDYVKTPADKIFMRNRIIYGLTEVVAYAKSRDVLVMAENFSKREYPLGTIKEMKDILDNVPDLKYNFDTGNFYFRGSDMLEAYETLKDYIVDIHVKDWIFDKSGPYHVGGKNIMGCAIGNGFLPIKELFQRLKRDEYHGQVMIEINPGPTESKVVEDSVTFLVNNCVVRDNSFISVAHK